MKMSDEACPGCEVHESEKNGIMIKADVDFGAIEISFVVSGETITTFLTTEEAANLSNALVDAIVKMKESGV